MSIHLEKPLSHMTQPLTLLGAGNMGGALLKRWLAAGYPPENITVITRTLKEDLRKQAQIHGFTLIDKIPMIYEGLLIIAIKPQQFTDTLPTLINNLMSNVGVVSLAAGRSLDTITTLLAGHPHVMRAMPNTPAAIGKGVTGIIKSSGTDAQHFENLQQLFAATGTVICLKNDEELDILTPVSGSGPAYIFYMVEALAAAAVANGLPHAKAEAIARATIIGAAALLEQETNSSARALREAVTSPGGTTQAALQHIMDKETGFEAILRDALRTACQHAKLM